VSKYRREEKKKIGWFPPGMQFLSVFGQNGGFLACSWDATQYTTPQRHVADETGTNYLPRDRENAPEIGNIHISSPNNDIFSLT
jgi:hypothetical protein